ncbi:DNA mismatch repair protein [bacterium]|nr:DNA mismatch repair protein [bacterium]
MENGIGRSQKTLHGCDDAIVRYQQHLSDNSQRQDLLRRKDQLFGHIRLGLFLSFLVFFSIAALWSDAAAASWLAWGSMIAFLITVTVNEPLRDELVQHQKKVAVIKRLIARLKRDWKFLDSKRLTESLSRVPLPQHQREVAGDLDLLGKASLFHFVSMTYTEPGIRTLASWLAGPVESNLAKQRAKAAKSLAPKRDERLRFYTLSRQVSECSGSPEQFVQWAMGGRWLSDRMWLAHWSALSTLLTAVFFSLAITSMISLTPSLVFRIALMGLGALVVINLTITTLMLGPAHRVFTIAMSSRRSVNDYQEIFNAADLLRSTSQDDGDDLLSRLRSVMLDDELSAANGMADLQKLAWAGGLRQSAGTFLIYLPLQCLVLWDIRVLNRLERWQEKYGPRVEAWFHSLGELEALMSVAALRDEYPSWCEPTWVESSVNVELKGRGVGHPLLSDADRVCNDVTVGPQGSILLVTGSNMSGKSTMLRSIGLNASLAAVGAPLCANYFNLPSLELATSIRVSDDISQGVSFYMAELKRLKSVVDHAREMAAKKDRFCLFLLDEILQGTNSRERQIAVVQVLQHLMNFGAIGAISTHDLELADEPELMSVSHVVHFRLG